MAEDNEGFVPAFGRGVLGVGYRLPFARFSHDEEFDVVLLKSFDLLVRPCGSGQKRNLRDEQVWVADDADGAGAGAGLEIGGNLGNGGTRQSEPMRVGLALVGLPSELIDHADEDAVGLAQVPGVVKAPDDEVVITNVGELLLLDGIGGERRLIVEMVIEGGLVRDDQVLAAGDCFFEDGVCVHECGDDAGDRRVGIAGLERVDGVGGRSGSGGCDDALHDFGGGEGRALREGRRWQCGYENDLKREVNGSAPEHEASMEFICKRVYPRTFY